MPTASIIVVSDYGAEEGRLSGLSTTLAAVAEQQHFDDVEVLLVAEPGESDALQESVRGASLPPLRTVWHQAETSYELQNAGVRAARGDWVILLDADCRPAPGWLRVESRCGAVV